MQPLGDGLGRRARAGRQGLAMLPALRPNEIERAHALGMMEDQAFAAKIRAYGAEAKRFGAESIDKHLERRPGLVRAGLLSEQVVWPLPPEPDPATVSGMTAEAHEAWSGVRNVDDAERVQAEFAARQRAREQAEHERLVEEARRELDGDAA